MVKKVFFIVALVASFSVVPAVFAQQSNAVSIQNTLNNILQQIQQLQVKINAMQGSTTGTKPIEFLGPPARTGEITPSQTSTTPAVISPVSTSVPSITVTTENSGYVTLSELPGNPTVSCVLPEMKQGIQNNSVYLLQSLLKEAGYYPEGFITGYYGALTKKAVQNFQKSQNILPNDGFVLGQTLSALNILVQKYYPQECGSTTPPIIVGGITVTSPAAGDVWHLGQTYKILWNSGMSPDVQVKITLNYPIPACVNSDPACMIAIQAPYIITANTPNIGSYEWTIPSDLSSRYIGTQQVITVQTVNGSTTGTSGAFTISSLTSGKSPVISGVSGPTNLNVGQTGTWVVKAYDPDGGTLNYSVIWGDEIVATGGVGYNSSTLMPPQPPQTGTFTHVYNTAGTYYPKFTVTDTSGLSAQTSLSVAVGNSGTATIKVISPNGGESWTQGTAQMIRWQNFYPPCPADDCYYSPNYSGTYSVFLQYMDSSSGRTETPDLIASGLTSTSYLWTVPVTQPAGKYKISVQGYVNNMVQGYDSSDAPFSIVSVTGGTATIKVISPNGGEVWTKGTIQTINWTDSNNISTHEVKLVPYYPSCAGFAYINGVEVACPINSTVPVHTPYTIANTQGSSYNWSVGKTWESNSVPDGSYTIQVCQSGTTNCDSSNVPFSIVSSQIGTATTKVVSPNGGEVWQAGNTYTIKWNTTGFSSTDPVQIGLYDVRYDTEGGPYMEIMIANTFNSGQYIWTIPTNIYGGSDFDVDGPHHKIKIYVGQGGSPGVNFDESDTPFSIVSAPVVIQLPVINSLSPMTVSAMGSYMITGSGFSSSGNTIMYSSAAGTGQVSGATSQDGKNITTNFPNDYFFKLVNYCNLNHCTSVNVDVRVQTQNGGSNTKTLTVNLYAVSISSVSPSYGGASTIITLNGSGFTSTNNTIKFTNSQITPYSLSGISSSNGTTITFSLPASVYSLVENYCKSYPAQCSSLPLGIQVFNDNGSSNSATFTVWITYSTPNVTPAAQSNSGISSTSQMANTLEAAKAILQQMLNSLR